MSSAQIEIESDPQGQLSIELSGTWKLGDCAAGVAEVHHQLSAHPASVSVTGETVTEWDVSLISFLFQLYTVCQSHDIPLCLERFPEGVNRLFALATAVPPRGDATSKDERPSLLVKIGTTTQEILVDFQEQLRFVGDVTMAATRLCIGRARFPWSDLGSFLHESGPKALGIVSLISFLVGLILAFVGAIQLRLFGAQIYVADLVGIAMVRELAAIMTAIVMAGRTGAAYAAQLGTMQVNEEIDSFRTMGISPIEFLVLPRMLALLIVMPLLTIYANILGILGGMVVGTGVLGIGFLQYWNQSMMAIRLNDLWIGLFMSFVFGILVAGAGCLRGMQCGRSSSAVGRATTSAVVTGIVSVVIATAIITYLCDVLKI